MQGRFYGKGWLLLLRHVCMGLYLHGNIFVKRHLVGQVDVQPCAQAQGFGADRRGIDAQQGCFIVRVEPEHIEAAVCPF